VSSATAGFDIKMRATVSASTAGTPRARYVAASSRRSRLDLVSLDFDLMFDEIVVRLDRDQLAGRHRKGTGEADRARIRAGAGNAEDERDVGDEPVSDAKHRRPCGIPWTSR